MVADGLTDDVIGELSLRSASGPTLGPRSFNVSGHGCGLKVSVTSTRASRLHDCGGCVQAGRGRPAAGRPSPVRDRRAAIVPRPPGAGIREPTVRTPVVPRG